MKTTMNRILLGLAGFVVLTLSQQTVHAVGQARNTSINQHLRQKLNTWHDSVLSLKKENARLLKENSELSHEQSISTTNTQNLITRNESLERDNHYLRQKSNDLETRLESLEDLIKDSRLN